MLYMGIDPGASGGMAWIREDEHGCATSYAEAMPHTERDICDLITNHSHGGELPYVLIERVHSMPRQGVSSTFKFGKNYGLLRGILIALQLPFEEVSPQTWQRAMSCLTHGDKNVSKAKAQQLFPHLKVTHAIADALLIAEYNRRSNHAE